MSKDSENRDIIISELKQEMMGPGEYPGVDLDCSVPIHFDTKDETYGVFVQKINGEEILKTSPLSRYTVGVIFPLPDIGDESDDTLFEVGTGVESDEDDETMDEDQPDQVKVVSHGGTAEYDEDSDEQSLDVFKVNSYRPSSMGVSLFVNIKGDSDVVVEVTGARYRRKVVTIENDDRDWWLRIPIKFQVRFSPDAFNDKGPTKITPEDLDGDNEGIGVEIYYRDWEPDTHGVNEGNKLLTVSLINRTNPEFGTIVERCLFQSRFEVSVIGQDGGSNICPYPSGDLKALDEEEKSLRLLYRNRKTFAIGHGCSADWVVTDKQTFANSVIAEVMPIAEIPNVTSDINRFGEENLIISMKSLAGLVDGDDGFGQLYELVKRYRNWISVKEKLYGIEDQLEPIANIHIENCKSSLASMEEGLEYLKTDDIAMKAFQLANKAVLMQQIAVTGNKRRYQYDNNAKKASFSEPFKAPNLDDIPVNRGYWRPFQVAFLLTTIKAVGEPHSVNRDIVDLLWFPTGGGKTEAYLGLTAFSIFLRRLRNPADSGVNVLMRYTLRLLTSQQFQRASSLICSMEIIRREIQPHLGQNPISIGLWLGGGTTPNSANEAKQRYLDLNKGNANARSGSSFVVLQCPWCSAQIGSHQNTSSKADKLIGYKRIGNEIVIACSDIECPFYSKLPLYVVDDYIYDNQPDLLIGTVDKFAQLAWRPEARRLFGIDENGNRSLSPPSLIIQDELHLISGPLGSMVGIYEGLIDDLCTDKRNANFVKPKIISSTATIRRSDRQIQDLYNRKSVIFPRPGTEIEDSFFSSFAEYDKAGDHIPGKKYVGINALNSGSTAGAQVQVYSALIQAPMELESQSRDPWWTIMAFYNSLRELGSSSSIIFHEVQNALRPLYNRKNKGTGESNRRYVRVAKELTGRIRDEELGTILDDLSIGVGDDSKVPYDICLASNIIEVGIDIDRLALMLVVGQPKTTSQYIQVTGRVGRQWERGIPGLVVTLYGAGKPRDKSHFEKFRSYHDQLYAHVEPTSVTPFASPVLDRALAACMIAYIRQNGIQDDAPYPFAEDLAEDFRNIFFERIKSVDPGELDNFQNLYNKLVDQWNRFGKFEWGRAGGIPGDNDLMATSSNYIKPEQIDTIWRIPNTLRSVDSECQATVTRLYLEDDNG